MPKFKFTMEQGQFLLNTSVVFMLPDKLGESTYNFVDKSLAQDEVRALYSALRSYSPALQDSAINRRRIPVFGPLDEWELEKDAKGQPTGGALVDPQKTIEVTLSEMAVSGIMWCLLLAMHPDGRDHRASISVIETIVLPIAQVLGKSKALREAVGLSKTEKRRHWADDPIEEKVGA